jgi:hypothetical protein
VHEQRHSDVEVVHREVVALLVRARVPHLGPDLLDRPGDRVPLVARDGGLSRFRIVQAGTSKLAEILGVRAGAETDILAREQLFRARDDLVNDLFAYRSRAELVLELVERFLAGVRVGPRGFGHELLHALIETVLPHELVVVEHRDAERRSQRPRGVDLG